MKNIVEDNIRSPKIRTLLSFGHKNFGHFKSEILNVRVINLSEVPNSSLSSEMTFFLMGCSKKMHALSGIDLLYITSNLIESISKWVFII